VGLESAHVISGRQVASDAGRSVPPPLLIRPLSRAAATTADAAAAAADDGPVYGQFAD